MFKDWVEPFFKAGPLDKVTIRAGSTTAIAMDEEIPAPIIVAIVTGYSGSQKPTIGRFDVGNNFDLGLDFVLNSEGEWEMVVNNQQDYEQEQMQQYLFYIEIDARQVMVQISIRNIFDNSPLITADKNPCVIKVKSLSFLLPSRETNV